MHHEPKKYTFVFVILVFLVVFSSFSYGIKNIKEFDISCVDRDGDGFNSDNCFGGLDCNDNNINISPLVNEICGNDIDENCDGIIEQCILDDLEIIDLTYSGRLKINHEINFNLLIKSTLENNKLLVKIDDEKYLFDVNESFNFNHTFLEEGEHKLTFILDPESKILEINENNNNIKLILVIEGIYVCDFQNEITGCVVCNCGNGEVCISNGECKADESRSPVIPLGLRKVSFYPDIEANYIYVFGERILESRELNGLTYLHNDFTKTLSFTTDEFGEKSKEILIFPFGEYDLNVFDKGNFEGKERDDSGLYYFGARYYDSSSGRFTQVDPILRDSESNYYLDKNNPFKFNDPDGREERDIRDNKIVVRKYGPYDYVTPNNAVSGYSLISAPKLNTGAKSALDAMSTAFKYVMLINIGFNSDARYRVGRQVDPGFIFNPIEYKNTLNGRFDIEYPTVYANPGEPARLSLNGKAFQVFTQANPLTGASYTAKYLIGENIKTDIEIINENFIIKADNEGYSIAEIINFKTGEIREFEKMSDETERAYEEMLVRFGSE